FTIERVREGARRGCGRPFRAEAQRRRAKRRAHATDVRGEMGKETPCQDGSCQRSSLRLGVFASENPAPAAGQGAASAALTSPIDVHPGCRSAKRHCSRKAARTQRKELCSFSARGFAETVSEKKILLVFSA